MNHGFFLADAMKGIHSETTKYYRVMPQEERITFDHMPSILSFLVKEVRELKALIMKGQEEEPEDVWMDINALCAYHPSHPTKKTVYDWVTHKRIPYHKDGHRLRFLRSEIDEWLMRGFHQTECETYEDAIGYVNKIREGKKK
ncbi:MAG: helix-turn-helix domain-containing protein [Bacteroidales bacterium]|jgi:excisionase family DNA binding protein|nr:helix-turn-helix domain-containing protein [Bacteroidales bacterium]